MISCTGEEKSVTNCTRKEEGAAADKMHLAQILQDYQYQHHLGQLLQGHHQDLALITTGKKKRAASSTSWRGETGNGKIQEEVPNVVDNFTRRTRG